jgi:hypothetical protein
VDLPGDVQANVREKGERRLDQLAQALCGCWVVDLSGRQVSRLMGAIMISDDHYGERRSPAAFVMRN